MKLTKALREVLEAVIGASVHDYESSCKLIGSEACKRCVAMRELKRIMREGEI